MTDPDKMIQDAMRLPIVPQQSCMNCKNLVDDLSHLTASLRFRCSAHGFVTCDQCNSNGDCRAWELGEVVKINEKNAYGSALSIEPLSKKVDSYKRSSTELFLVALFTSALTAILLSLV